ncbi:hypothetical protein LTR36_006671 [Oleoguttula mirabilis]|uniref:Uncharacterized protein n=1 Tax=Oleoguttula mirabilis TaxID=1507867 RepID=A0AAV9JCT7_9PEZI|nr:hypothetical protein LTR36_006671 [Oleoguttula mirabilis]
MAFLKRSKSQKVPSGKDVERNEEPAPERSIPEQDEVLKDRRKSKHERRRSIFTRSKSADARRSTERPRTANRNGDHRGDLQTLGESIEIREGGDTFNFPTPSPRLPPKNATFQAAPSPLGAGEGAAIGLAIGSPSHVAPNWGRSFTSIQPPTNTDRLPPPVRAHTTQAAHPGLMESPAKAPELRKKKSSWKILGGLFHRHSPKPEIPEPFYKVHMEPESKALQARPLIETPSPSPGPLQSPGSISSHHARTPSVTRGMARFEARAEADRASFMPNIESKIFRTPADQRVGTLPAPKPLGSIRDSEDMFTTLQGDRKDSPMSTSGITVPGAVPRTPRLDLDFPSGEMERYSVMFEKLLEPRQSILERRQSKLKRLNSKTNKEAVTSTVPSLPHISQPTSERRLPSLPQLTMRPPQSFVPQRSMTSPHLTKVPALNITVAKKDGTSVEEPVTAIHRPRPIQRSKTAPTGATSPAAPNFSRPKPPTFASSDSDVSPSSPLYGEDSLPPTPTTMTTVTDCESMVAVSRGLMPLKGRHTDDSEPSWDMLTSKATNWSTDGLTREPYPRVSSPEELERHMVQVSVARQVSVSRARRHVQKAVDSKQPLKPRVVELSKNRKSTFVVIESGDD